MSDFVMSDFAI